MPNSQLSRICLIIDLGRLRHRLSLEQGRTLTESEVHAWLNRAGFQLRDSWYCDSGDASALRPEEILEQSTLHTSDGVTFVHTQRMQPPTA